MDVQPSFPILSGIAVSLALLMASPEILAKQGGPSQAPVVKAEYFDHGERMEAKVALGQLLFFDKILSGNKNTSCATCHHSLTNTTDGLSLPIGEGGRGLGVTRDTGSGDDEVPERVPRNSPHVFNLDALEFTVMFHDGRLAVDASQPSGFLSPAGEQFPPGLDNALAAQAMFPVTSGTEMAGQLTENEIADAAAAGELAGANGVWELLAARLRAIPEYVDLFKAAYADILTPQDITYVHAANAIGAFEGVAGRTDNSPFDRFLNGEERAMSGAAKRGMRLFYGAAGCSGCHSGLFQTDHQYHAIAMPQIGPGKGDNLPGYDDGLDDFGRERVTGDPADRFKFRTPTLRNVELTAPYGHAGAHDGLEAVVRHHLDSVASLYAYDPAQAVLPPRADLDALDFEVMSDPDRVAAIAAANELRSVRLTNFQVAGLIEFLRALTDPAALDLRREVPTRVPSGLTLAE